MVNKILIAEDESIIALALKRKVESWGYSVCTITKTGKETIISALQDIPDLLIIDVYLEDDVDGIDAVMEIHKNKFIPVIYITASTDSLTLQKAQKTKMLKYMNKPYNEMELIDAIHSISHYES